MKTYLNKILNNCDEVSLRALKSEEREIPMKELFEMRLHIMFCKCCKNFIKQSNIIDKQLKLYKDKIYVNPPFVASDALKEKLNKIIRP